jgi:hypothetical protein
MQIPQPMRRHQRGCDGACSGNPTLSLYRFLHKGFSGFSGAVVQGCSQFLLSTLETSIGLLNGETLHNPTLGADDNRCSLYTAILWRSAGAGFINHTLAAVGTGLNHIPITCQRLTVTLAR